MKLWKTLKKAYSLRDFPAVALMFVVAGITISIGGDVLQTIRTTQTGNETDYNVTTNALDGIKQMGNWLEIIGLVVAASIVIGILLFYFGAGMTRS